jgi:poly(A) polymerase
VDDLLPWPTILNALSDAAAAVGAEGWLVGGCLRDALLGVPVADVDVALSCEPLSVAEHLTRSLPAAVARLGHGTIRLIPRHSKSISLDLTLLHGGTIAADLAARDFSVNAMALPLMSYASWIDCIASQSGDIAELIDPYGGRRDLLARRAVAVGPGIFHTDPGRILRLARLRARFRLIPDDETLLLARNAVPLLAPLSADRLRDELDQVLGLPDATTGIVLLDSIGALAGVFPGLSAEDATRVVATLRQLDALMGISSGGADYPAISSWSEHPARRVALRRLAVDVWRETTTSALPARRALFQQACATLDIDNDQSRWLAARQLFARTGKDGALAADMLAVAAAAAGAIEDDERGSARAARAEALLETFTHHREALIPAPLLSGRDVIAELGVRSGPEIGRLLALARQAQLAGEVSTRDEALALARHALDA